MADENVTASENTTETNEQAATPATQASKPAVRTAGLLAWVAGVAACSLVSVVFSDAVTFSSAMASSLRKLHVVQR